MTSHFHNNTSVTSCTKDTVLVRIKVEEDIAFLQARITLLEKHPRPNRVVLETYQNMLNSRMSVLKWLLHGAADSDSAESRRSA